MSKIIFLIFDFSDFKVVGKCFADQQQGNVHMGCIQDHLGVI